MLFVNLSSSQVASYSYACAKLQSVLRKMKRMRKALEDAAAASSNKSFAKCMYMFACESLQFEREINAQIESFNCRQFNITSEEHKDSTDISFTATNMETICNYIEENYLKPYKQLLKDKYLNTSLKSLINNQFKVTRSNLTQLRLFNDVEAALG